MTIITLNNVQHIYDGRTVLNLPQWSVNSGEIVGIVGPSGAGKSTLLRLLALLEVPTVGQVSLNLDKQPATFDHHTLPQRRRIAMVFQRPILLSRSVRANIAYGLRLRGAALNGQIDETLERLALTEVADARPQTLSGGEIQRIAVARAMILKPDVLLLDEPTANLDPHNIRVIEDYLREAHADYQPTIIIVTHNIFQARRLASQMLLLLNGEMVEQGTPQQLFENPQDERTAAFIKGDLIY